MFFSKPGIYEPCGIYNFRHFLIAVITLVLVAIAVK